MAAQGVSPADMHHRVAKDKDDYADADTICQAASEDGFPNFFEFHRKTPQPNVGFGHLICSWSVMRMWRDISEGTATAVAWLDDYALRVPATRLNRLVNTLQPDILQLAWHKRDDIFEHDNYNLGRKWAVPTSLTRSPADAQCYKGAMGASDWAIVLSPAGAKLLLDYMAHEPRLNTECAIAGLYADWKIPKLYSVVDSHPESNGLNPIFGNRWVLELSAYTDRKRSDLLGLHEGRK